MFDQADRPVVSACFFACIALLCLYFHWGTAALWACIGAFALPIGALMGDAVQTLPLEIDHE